MPPICWHLATSRLAAQRLAHRAIQDHLGCFLLGTTAPDIRVMLQVPREQTHFYDLARTEQESGARRIFQLYPDLTSPSLRDDAQRALVAGYLTHLAVDERWIETVYRPCFGRESPLTQDPAANLLDRIVQFEIDRRERVQHARMEEIDRLLLGYHSAGIGFLDGPTLVTWRDRIRGIVAQEPTWDLFRRFAGRYYASEAADHIMAQVPELLERALDYLTPDRVDSFREQAIAISAEVVEGYLE
ncbi:MAG: hypothetical protein HY689_10995 [Chloroflexi bacterium]|nr:hypothetical protein [Chloroflexota bacterium]